MEQRSKSVRSKSARSKSAMRSKSAYKTEDEDDFLQVYKPGENEKRKM
jgi:hypothetical protein